jgi:hypothetical protein
MEQNNKGISISGGNFQADQVSVGANTSSIQNINYSGNQVNNPEKEKVDEAIAELLRVIEFYRGSVLDEERVLQEVKLLKEETQRKNPNKFTLKGLLVSLKESLSSVAEISEKIVILQKAVALMIGSSIL